MNKPELKLLLEQVRAGAMPIDAALARIRALPFANLEHAKVDLHRPLRHGAPEVIFCPGKTKEHIRSIVETLRGAGQHVLATRATREIFEHCAADEAKLKAKSRKGAKPAKASARGAISSARPLRFHPASGVMTDLDLAENKGAGLVLVISAGTSDIPVAEEAALTARACGSKVKTIYDVGVSGLHRLLAHVEELQRARALVVVAGMEGALPSVVGGLVAAPVVAVPTSIGYGASFGGLAALLGMLNSCANNVTVVNIDNGFGAGYVASLINLQLQRGQDEG